MIIEHKQKHIVAENQINATLSINDLSYLMNLLGKNIYENKYSFINELAQNMTDTTNKAKSKGKECKNSYVYLTYEKGTNYVCFQDYGEGMSVAEAQKYLFQYGSSTKREDNITVGAKGIGAFSILKFSNQAIYSTVKDGIKYEFLLLDDNPPKFVPINTSYTDEENGTLVKIPFKEEDLYRLKKELIKRLLYYDNVNCSLINQPLYKNELFYFSPQNENKYLHLNYFGYQYDIDFSKIGIDVIYLPIAINIDKLNVTASRERIEYDDDTIELIKEKINSILEYISKNIDLQFTDIVKYIEFKYRDSVLFKDLFRVKTTLLLKEYYNNYVFKPLEIFKNKPFIKWEIINNSKRDTFYYNLKKIDYESECKDIEIFIIDSDLTKRSKDFLKQHYYIYKSDITLKELIEFLGLKKYPKNEWRNLINFYFEWFKSTFSISNTSDIKNNESYKDYCERFKSNTKKSTIKYSKCLRLTKNNEIKAYLRESSYLGNKVIKVNKDTPNSTVIHLLKAFEDYFVVKGKEDNSEEFLKNFYSTNIVDIYKASYYQENRHLFRYTTLKALDLNLEKEIEDFKTFLLSGLNVYGFYHKKHLEYIEENFKDLLLNEEIKAIKDFETKHEKYILAANIYDYLNNEHALNDLVKIYKMLNNE